MTEQRPHNSVESVDNETFISEQCLHCHIELEYIEEIFVDIESDNYYCEECSKYLQLNVRPCKEMF